MKSLSTVSILILPLVFASTLVGCKAASMLFTPQEWSKNYALADGVEANDPAFIDGDLNTMGRSRFPEDTVDNLQFLLSEALIALPEPKPIHRIVIHSPNMRVFDILSRDESGGWQLIKEVKSNNKEVIDLRVLTVTDGIRIRVRRTSDDAAQRRKNTTRDRWGVIWVRGNTRASADIKEIELYGFTDKADIGSTASQKEDALDELFNE